jgi:hypothetical protein
MLQSPVPETMRLLEQAISRRLGYLLITGRLSERSREEMAALSEQLGKLADVLPQTGASVAARSHLLVAYTREVRRAGSVIIADGRQQREDSAILRSRAKAARDASARAAARSRLHVVKDVEPSLDLLQRVLEPEDKAG